MSQPEPTYRYLQPKRGSHYQQLAVNGRIRAEVLYRETLGPEARTPAEVAGDYGLPIDAVLEAVRYCEANPAVLEADRARETATIAARGLDRWPHAPRRADPAA